MGPFDFLQYEYFGNTIQNYLVAAGIFLLFVFGSIVLHFLIKNIFGKLAEKTATKIDDTIVEILNKIVVFMLILAGIYFALEALVMPQNIWEVIEKIIQVIVILKIIQGITMLVDSIIENYLAKYLAHKGHFDVQLTKLISRIINIAIWIIGISLILRVFNYDITAIITGLGIGGLAIALAAQDTLGNFFSSVAIIADKPFKIGDIIKFGAYEGTITDIGMRTTRIETYFGTQIAVPNSELAKSVVENLSKRKSRRCDGKIGLVYDTSTTQVKKAMKIIKDTLKANKETTDDFRVNFTQFGDHALMLEFTYYVINPDDYSFYLKTVNNINLEIKQEFTKEGIRIAFPTQTIHLSRENTK
ncbi:mechanosensitive ion channel family protein [Candidatus Peregrinibacteria bacterium]|nr:mechanosensitive ion channel family protein [Candidatus Peregrinibacteria bacterium]